MYNNRRGGWFSSLPTPPQWGAHAHEKKTGPNEKPMRIIPPSIVRGMSLGVLQADDSQNGMDDVRTPLIPSAIGNSKEEAQIPVGVPADEASSMWPSFLRIKLSNRNLRILNRVAVFVHFVLTIVAIAGRCATSALHM